MTPTCRCRAGTQSHCSVLCCDWICWSSSPGPARRAAELFLRQSWTDCCDPSLETQHHDRPENISSFKMQCIKFWQISHLNMHMSRLAEDIHPSWSQETHLGRAALQAQGMSCRWPNGFGGKRLSEEAEFNRRIGGIRSLTWHWGQRVMTRSLCQIQWMSPPHCWRTRFSGWSLSVETFVLSAWCRTDLHQEETRVEYIFYLNWGIQKLTKE